MGFLKERWTEAEVLGLPDGEHNYFDRKSGKLFADKGKLYATLAKALSAFANSGGGHLVLGQMDDGTIDGVPPKKKAERLSVSGSSREFLSSSRTHWDRFRVHHRSFESLLRRGFQQTRDDSHPTSVKAGCLPHQAAFPADNPQYFYRQGGQSIAAPHHYLEGLRNRRLTFAVLESSLESVTVGRSHPEDDICRAVVENAFNFVVTIGFKFFGFEVYMDHIRQGLLPLEVHHFPISENHIGEPRRLQRLPTVPSMVHSKTQ